MLWHVFSHILYLILTSVFQVYFEHSCKLIPDYGILMKSATYLHHTKQQLSWMIVTQCMEKSNFVITIFFNSMLSCDQRVTLSPYTLAGVIRPWRSKVDFCLNTGPRTKAQGSMAPRISSSRHSDWPYKREITCAIVVRSWIQAGICLWSRLVGLLHKTGINTLRPRQMKQHFADDIFKRIFFNENFWFSIKISLKFVPKGPINNIPALVKIMAWRRPGDKPLSEPVIVSLLTHICVTRPQWVNTKRIFKKE